MNSTNNFWIFRADVFWKKYLLTVIFMFGLFNSVSGEYFMKHN